MLQLRFKSEAHPEVTQQRLLSINIRFCLSLTSSAHFKQSLNVPVFLRNDKQNVEFSLWFLGKLIKLKITLNLGKTFGILLRSKTPR